MDSSHFHDWNHFVEQAVCDIQETLSVRKGVPLAQCEALLALMSKEIIEEICLERNWNSICASLQCSNFRRVIAKVNESVSRSWFCCSECYDHTRDYIARAETHHPNSRNITKHLSVLYPHVPLENIEKLYRTAHGQEAHVASTPVDRSASLKAGSAATRPQWKAGSTPAPKTMSVKTSYDLAQKMHELRVDEESASSDGENEEFSLYQCFPLLSLLLEAWSTPSSAHFIATGQLSNAHDDAASPHKKDMEFILEQIGAALAEVPVNLPAQIIDEIPLIVSTFDLTRQFGFQELMKNSSSLKSDLDSGSWFPFAMVLMYAIARARFPEAIHDIKEAAAKHSPIDAQSIESLAKLLSDPRS